MTEKCIRIEIGRRQFIAGLACGLIGLLAGETASESLTLTASYPAPFGIYSQIVTTGGGASESVDTVLSRNRGNAVLVPPTNRSGRVGVGTSDPQAILDIQSTASGLLVPRMNTAQRNAINTVGTVIFNTEHGALEFRNPTGWKTVAYGVVP